jgi:hypothetical protein
LPKIKTKQELVDIREKELIENRLQRTNDLIIKSQNGLQNKKAAQNFLGAI